MYYNFQKKVQLLLYSFKFRDDERTNQYNKNIIIMFGTKIVSILISLFYVPFFLSVFNLEDYGLFLTLTSIIGWLTLLDVGLSNGLRNKLTYAVANKDFVYAKKLISTSYIAVSFYTLIIFLIFQIVSYLIDWTVVLNVNRNRIQEITIVVNVVFISFCFNFIISVFNAILLAFQMPYFQSIISIVCQFTTISIVFILVYFFNINNLLAISTIISFIPPLILLIFSIILFNTKFKSIRPSIKEFDFLIVGEIMTLGIKFFVIQIITLIIFQSNNLIITHVCGNESVVIYNVALRYLESIGVIFTIFITPIWSASAEALTRGDFKWIIKTVKKMKTIAFVVFIIGLVLVLFSNTIFTIWLGKNKIAVSQLNLFILLVFVSSRNFYQCFGYVINGSGKIMAQLVITLFVAVLYIPLSIYFGNKFGLNGVLGVLASSQIINYLWSRYQFDLLMTKNETGIWSK